MRNGLMRRLALIAHKGETEHTDTAKAKLFLDAAIGTRNVGRLAGQLFDAVFGQHGARVCCIVLYCC